MSKPTFIALHCPCCNNMFESYKLDLETNITHQTTDFFVISEGNQPIYYMIHPAYSRLKELAEQQKLNPKDYLDSHFGFIPSVFSFI